MRSLLVFLSLLFVGETAMAQPVKIRVAYVDYLFKFARKFDPRLDERRLVMSQPMTSAARDLWIDITRPELRS